MHKWRTRTVAVSALVAGLMATTASPGAGAAVPDQWAAPSATGANTGANLGERAITASSAARLQSAWRMNDGGNRSISPVIARGVVYQAVDGSTTTVSRLVALDVRTGKRLWQIPLAGPGRSYIHGPSLAGDVLVLPYSGYRRPAGVTAVNVKTRKVLWSRSRPPATDPTSDDSTSGPVVVDAGRVYFVAAGTYVSAHDLRTGRLVWQKSLPGSWVEGMAASGGRLYTGGSATGLSEPSLVVYDGRTGRRLWSARGVDGRPVVVGATVLAMRGSSVVAFPAAGCGRSACSPRWSTALPGAHPGVARIGGAAGSTAFVVAGNTLKRTTRLLRLDTSTGRVQWSANRPHGASGPPIRAGSTVWLFENATTITGWSVSGSATKPLRTIQVAADDQGALATLSVAGGTLVHASWPDKLTGYRIRGR